MIRFLKHSRDKSDPPDFQERVLLHIPLGFIMGLIPFNRGLVKLVTRYQDNEDLHHKDQAWKDYAGIIAGYIPGRLALIALLIILILKLLG